MAHAAAHVRHQPHAQRTQGQKRPADATRRSFIARQSRHADARVPDSERAVRVWIEGEHVILVDFDCSRTFKAGPPGEEPVRLDTWLGTPWTGGLRQP
jgi:hypothetical protein